MSPALVLLVIVILLFLLIGWVARHTIIVVFNHRLEVRRLEIQAHAELHHKRLELEYDLTQRRLALK